MTQDSTTTKDDLYYQAMVTGWITTKFERDKSILTLAAGGIGAVVTLMTTVGPTSMLTLFFYVAAIIAFVVSLVTIVIIFDKNGDHFVAIVNGKDEPDAKLQAFDKVAFWSFAIGAISLAFVGVIVGYHKLSQPEAAKPSLEVASATPRTVPVTDREPVQINITNTQAGECLVARHYSGSQQRPVKQPHAMADCK